MTKTKAKQVRLNFTDKEMDLYIYLNTKTSKSAFMKDLIRREMLRDNNYINFNNQISVPDVTPVKETNDTEYEFDLDDLDLD